MPRKQPFLPVADITPPKDDEPPLYPQMTLVNLQARALWHRRRQRPPSSTACPTRVGRARFIGSTLLLQQARNDDEADDHSTTDDLEDCQFWSSSPRLPRPRQEWTTIPGSRRPSNGSSELLGSILQEALHDCVNTQDDDILGMIETTSTPAQETNDEASQ